MSKTKLGLLATASALVLSMGAAKADIVIATVGPMTGPYAAFGEQMTSPGNPKGAPKLFYTEIALDVDAFLKEWEENPFLPPPIPGVHPQKLSSALRFLKESSEPQTATIGLASVLDQVVYRSLSVGFFLSSGDKMNFYRFPSEEVLQRDHYAWYRSTD